MQIEGVRMGEIARNAIKGYTYQNYVFTLFLAKMDTERKIKRIESESIGTAQFDDLFIEEENAYRIQIKNYRGVQIDEITVNENTLMIKNNTNRFNPSDNNVVVVNSSLIETDTIFMGFHAKIIGGVVIVPLSESDIQNHLDSMFSTETRELQIIQWGYQMISSSQFVVEIKDLPRLIRISTDLEDKTVLVRETMCEIPNGITHIVGKPGVGKSHYVNELIEKVTDAVVYRFWTGSQDENIRIRLTFDRFLDDLALGIFNSPRSYEVQDLIDEINGRNIRLIIDGLDHVENYNPLELSKYIEFINSLTNAKVLVLSRPLRTDVDWDVMELDNWNYDEAVVYLSLAHGITDYATLKKIYDIADGYPIITYFLAEHCKLHGEINVSEQLKSLNQYYDLLLQQVHIKKPLTLFATNNSFFLENEIDELLENQELADIVKEFITVYPYLFKRIKNRISLIHDSLNTYLKNQLSWYPSRRSIVSAKVKESLLQGNVEYMARMSSFDFDEDFFDDILVKYCDETAFENLLKSTVDYNSITSFYNQLQQILEKREGLFDVYQYYLFALIHQIVNRNDLNGYDELVYQLLLYLKSQGEIETQLFSSGAMWNLYILLENDAEREYKRYLVNNYYDSNEVYNVYQKIEGEYKFFERKQKRIKKGELERKLKKEYSYLAKKDMIIQYFVSVWIHKSRDRYYKILDGYLKSESPDVINALGEIIEKYGIERWWAKNILCTARYQLNELGYFGNNNIFRNKSLAEFICEKAPEGSFEVAENVKSFIRLVNYEKRIVDIESINLLWSMYYNRKDYSVYTIDDALITFENKGLINEMNSLEIIRRLMNQSEKGIRHLMVSYMNSKPIEFIKDLVERKYFDAECPADIFDLTPEHIDCFERYDIKVRIEKLIGYHYTSRWLEYSEIENVMCSKYKSLMLDALDYFEFSIHGQSDDADVIKMFEEHGIRYIVQESAVREEYVPFRHGCIHKEDREYILENQIPYIEIAKYTDGWHSCFPLLELYTLYEQNQIQRDYLKIIHTAMFARVSDLEYIGNWHLLIGNVPLFLSKFNIGVDWERLLEIFIWYLKASQIDV